ncbi:uncharacterized protein LOC123566028 isoform X2 [Mercenaria mercenaria]|uniref:uncharacterized protein LOC123566028 isoform X2 n=1 Tax=Mercenaria mercenaria TaxID=6596 RepID=UPI00234F3557|nr:uncharacterized protein LOC123566028 isoform X2 [Mercenaria mercenaria]
MYGLGLKWKMFLCSIVACFIFSIPVYRLYSNETYLDSDWSSQLPLHFDIDDITKKGTGEKITVLAKVIHSAKKHVRGSKTSQYLREAVSIINSILTDIIVDSENVYKRFNKKSSHICSETFKGGNFGFPMYYKGFETDSCDYGVSVSSLVTVIKYIIVKPNDVESKGIEIDQFLSSLYDTMNNVRTLIAVNAATFPNEKKTKYPLVKIIQSNDKSEGAALNKLIKEVKTPYVFVARNINFITNDSRLERLVREIESLNVVAAGGSIRDLNGHWKKGCFQSVYRNYTLKYIEGYDESFHECVFCDYIQGPFVTTTSYLKQNVFQEFDESNGLYEDWFLRLFQKGKETVVCPDAMFNVDNRTAQSDSNWTNFAQKWNLFKVKTPKGYTFTRSCEKQETSSRPSQSLSPCALQKMSNGVKTIMRICEETGVICELQEGTSLGAVKFGKVLPWDLDFDIRFLATNCSKCMQLESAFKKTADLKVDSFSSSCCNKKLKFGERDNFAIHYQGYGGDFTGHPVMDSDILSKAGLAPTKILFDGQWVNVPRNPGLFMRNRYGKELYQHAEHWRYSGGGVKNHRLNYTTNLFISCKQQSSHDCLDRYNADGDLPFEETPPP